MNKTEKMDDAVAEKPLVTQVGPFKLETDKGPTIFFDSILCENGHLDVPGRGKMVGIMLTTNVKKDGYWIGGVAQFTADEARTFAATLCQSADKLDGGKAAN